MSTPDETLHDGHGSTDACADASRFLISAFPGSGAESLLAALMPMPGLQVLRPLELAARSRSTAAAAVPSPDTDTDRRIVAPVWGPQSGADGLYLVRNPFHVLVELSAMVSPDGATPWARGALLGTIAQALFGEEISGLMPSEETFASLLAGLWARHVRMALVSGLPILQCEHVLTAPELWGARVAALARDGAPLPAAEADVMILPAADIRASNTPAPLSDSQINAIWLIAGDMMQACGYVVRGGTLIVGEVPLPPIRSGVGAAAFAHSSGEVDERSVTDMRLGRVLRALEIVQQREQTFDTMSQVISDLCRQQEEGARKSQREISGLQLEIAETRQALERLQFRAVQLQSDLATVRESYLTLADLEVIPPSAKCVRLGSDYLEIGRTRNTPAKISFFLPKKQVLNWGFLLSVTIDNVDDSPLPPIVVAYTSGGRARRLKHAVAAGDNHLAFILSQVDEGALLHLLIAPRIALYRIEDFAVLPLMVVSKPARSAPPTEESAPDT
ncbi:hypothetical protein ACRC7T_17975 (plasmid) [Segnochrobactraceae bacterium EtOH-i3]